MNGDGEYCFDGADVQLLCKPVDDEQDEAFVDDGTSYFVIQDGQYLIPTDGNTIVLQDSSGNEEDAQVVINDQNDLVIIDQTNELQQSPEILGVIDDENTADQVMYYTNELLNESVDDNVEMTTPLYYTIENTLDEPPPTKRYKLDQLVNLEDLVPTNLDENTDQEVQLVDDDTVDLSGLKYQYAVLKDGKLHIQVCNLDAMTNDDENDTKMVVTSDLQGQIDAFQESIAMDPSNVIDLSKITGRNLITGQTVTLDSYYFNKIQEQMNFNEFALLGQDTNEAVKSKKTGKDFDIGSYLNKKLVLGKTTNGKKLVGKILQIHKPVNENLQEETTPIGDDAKKSSNAPDDTIENNKQHNPITNLQELIVDSSGKILQIKEVNEPNVCAKNTVSHETCDYISKTFVGFMDMESIQGRLINKKLSVKVVEKIYDSVSAVFNVNISYVNGRMCLLDDDGDGLEKKWNFIVDGDDDCDTSTNDTVPLNFIITVDKTGKKTTRVTICPRSTDNKCVVCNREFKSPLKLKRHIDACHTNEGETTCDVCSKSFVDYRALQRHKRVHTTEHWYECPTCNKNFNSQGSLKRHMSVHDPNLRPLQCTLCLQRFTDQSSLKKHLLIHTGIKPYQCHLCLRSFVNQGDLNFHMRIHDPLKQFTCGTCGRQFSRHANLLRHMEIHKGNSDAYKCETCGCSYNYISSLTRHIVQNHISKEQA